MVRDRLRTIVFRIYAYFGTAPARPHYVERASLLVVLAAIFPAVIAYNDPSPRMRHWAVLYIRTPTGPICYHVHHHDVWIFRAAGVPIVAADDPRAVWDHSTQEVHNQRLQDLAREITRRRIILSTRTDTRSLDPGPSRSGHLAVWVVSQQPGVAFDLDTDIRLSNGVRIVVSQDAFVVSTTDGRSISFLENINIDALQRYIDLELRRD